LNAKLQRVLTGVVVAVIATILAPLMGGAPAFATGSLQGAATIKSAGGAANLQSGDGGTTFTLRLPTGASCPGDSANSNWHWDTYMVPSSVNPDSLQFGSTGPTPSGVGANFSQPLFDTSGTPIVNQQTANQTTANGPGAIINIPDMNFQVLGDGQIPSGVYNLGIACILGPASATQESNFWNVQMTITYAAGTSNPANNPGITWQNGTVPNAPVITNVDNGAPNGPGGTLVVSFTSQANPSPAYSNPAFTVTAHPSVGADVTATGNSSPITVTGLTNGTSYAVTMVATNATGNSAPSNSISGTPMNPQVLNLAAAPTPPSTVTLTWGQPQNATGPGTPPTSYTVTWTPTTTGPPTSPQTFACNTATCSDPIANLAPGTTYTFNVAYGAPGTANIASITGSPATVPTLTTTTPGSISVGQTTNDSATLSGGNNPTGTITFSLTDPSNAIVYTDVVTVSGNGTYSTAAMGTNPGGFTPSMLGTYQWVASYSGDTNNTPVSTSPGDEPVTAGCDQTLQPASGSVTLGSGTTCVSGMTINGNLKVPKGASVVLIDSTITGSLTASGANAVTVCNTTVDKSIRITGATGFVLLGDPGDDNCDPNTFSKVTLSKNIGGAELGQNTITGNVTVSRNTGSGPYAEDQGLELEGNSIGGKLSCRDNDPLSNGGRANSVTGTRKGQDCESPDF